MQLDHIFILVAAGAPEAARLAAAGFIEAPSNTHPGQGTACRRFLFENAYLELLWVNDPVQAQSEAVRPAFLWERWSGRVNGTCPFGLVFRPSMDGEREPPFSSWEYRPPYLPQDLHIAVGTNAARMAEPALFFLPFAKGDRLKAACACEAAETLGMKMPKLTDVTCVLPNTRGASPELTAVINTGLVQFRIGHEYLLILEFVGQNHTEREVIDCRPELPLQLRP